MRAALTPAYGPATLLDIQEVADPTPQPDQILVEVVASTVTKGDLRLRAADFPAPTGFIGRLMFGWSAPRRPLQGTCFSGRVVGVGSAVTRFVLGDLVFGFANDGAWAERLVIAADGPVARKPAGASHAEAAASVYGAGTALRFLRDLAGVRPGEHVLVLGGSGGVGRFAVQIARHLGAQVTAVGSAAAADLMRQLGAHAVLDHATTDYARTGTPYDIVFDVAHASSFAHARRALAPTGRYLSLGMSLRVLWDQLRTRFTGGPTAHFAIAMPTRDDMDAVATLLEDGAITPVLGERFPLDRVADAHDRAEADRHASVVLAVAAPRALRGVA
jgi:NADPH:quinone reductase-like Zn-dependent oxidoreductase